MNVIPPNVSQIAFDLDFDFLLYRGRPITNLSSPSAIDYALEYQIESCDVDFQVFVAVPAGVTTIDELYDYYQS